MDLATDLSPGLVAYLGWPTVRDWLVDNDGHGVTGLIARVRRGPVDAAVALIYNLNLNACLRVFPDTDDHTWRTVDYDQFLVPAWRIIARDVSVALVLPAPSVRQRYESIQAAYFHAALLSRDVNMLEFVSQAVYKESLLSHDWTNTALYQLVKEGDALAFYLAEKRAWTIAELDYVLRQDNPQSLPPLRHVFLLDVTPDLRKELLRRLMTDNPTLPVRCLDWPRKEGFLPVEWLRQELMPLIDHLLEGHWLECNCAVRKLFRWTRDATAVEVV